MTAAPVINALLAALTVDTCKTVSVLAEETGLANYKIVRAAAALICRGYATRAEVGCFTLTAEGEAFRQGGGAITSGPAGRLTQRSRRPHKSVLRDRIWAALRIKEKASTQELLMLAGDDQHDYRSLAARYLKALCRTGYLVELPRRAAGTSPTSNGYKRFRLVKDTGPEAPQMKTRSGMLFDPNTGESVKIGGDNAEA